MDRTAMRTLSRTRSLARQALPRRSLPSAARSISVVPRVAEASLWKSVIPKAFRRENRAAAAASKPKTPWLAKEWNPATFYIVIFLLIGSMAIQMISLRNNFTAFTRRADVRIGLLREVIERIQNGEEVDVEKVLGSGDTENEAAWEQMLQEVEKDTASRSQKKQEKAKSAFAADAKFTSDPEPTQTPSKDKTTYFF